MGRQKKSYKKNAEGRSEESEKGHLDTSYFLDIMGIGHQKKWGVPKIVLNPIKYCRKSY